MLLNRLKLIRFIVIFQFNIVKSHILTLTRQFGFNLFSTSQPHITNVFPYKARMINLAVAQLYDVNSTISNRTVTNFPFPHFQKKQGGVRERSLCGLKTVVWILPTIKIPRVQFKQLVLRIIREKLCQLIDYD